MKTEQTRKIEKALTTYTPAEMCGIKLNMRRGRTVAFEVPVENGTSSAGLIDCLCFGDLQTKRICS